MLRTLRMTHISEKEYRRGGGRRGDACDHGSSPVLLCCFVTDTYAPTKQKSHPTVVEYACSMSP